MGFFDKVKKAFGSKKEDESQNSVNDEVIDEPTFTENIENDNEEIQSNDLEETLVNDELIDKSTPNEKNRNFRYLDELIHSGVKEIVLESDIVLDPDEKSQYLNGIKLDADDLAIDGNGHAIDARGLTRIFRCTGKNITLKNITLKKGFAKGKGGAIHNESGEITINHSTLTGNTAKYHGGAIHNEKGEITITHSKLNNNTTQRTVYKNDGGAICNNEGEITITETALNNNAADAGGAIYNNDGEITMTKTALKENTAKFGGAIYNDHGGELTITESTLNNNTAHDYGGAIENSKGNFKIFNCKFSSNKCPNNIVTNYDSLQIHKTTFNDNQSKYIVLNDYGANLGIFSGEFKENNIEKSILYNDGKFCSVEKTVFQNNISNNTMNIINKSELTLTNPKIKDEGKSILNQNYMLIRKSSSELENTIFGEGTVEVDEKIIPQGENFDFGYLDKKIHESNTKEIILDHDITFENYERDFYEGGIELDMDNLIIDGNGKTISGSDKSRIFIITGKNIKLKNIIFKNGCSHENYDNPLNNNGGAIKINYIFNVTIENCQFINNTSEEYGGAIYNKDGEITITESTLNNNTANDGGAIHTTNGDITMTETTLQENTAVRGGAIYNKDGEITITESTLNNNTADRGGTIYNNDGEITITESTLNNNTADRGGTIYNDHGGELTITESTLNNNTANNGGAIYLYNATIYESENCTFKDNQPDDVYEDD